MLRCRSFSPLNSFRCAPFEFSGGPFCLHLFSYNDTNKKVYAKHKHRLFYCDEIRRIRTLEGSCERGHREARAIPPFPPRRGKFRDSKALAKARAFSCSVAAPFPH